MLARDLQYLLAISDHRHVGRAAAALGLSQPALSKSLRRLEESAQTLLFERSRHGVDLTAAGRIFVERARTIVRDIERAFEDVRSLEGEVHGSLKIGAVPSVCENLFSMALEQLLSKHANLSVNIVSNWNSALFAMLDSGEVDLIVTGLQEPLTNSRYRCLPLIYDQVAVIARPGHPLKSGVPVGFKEMQKHRWVMASAISPGRQWLDDQFKKHRVKPPKIVIESDSLVLTKQIIMDTDLLGFLPQIVVSSDLAARKLKAIPLQDEAGWQRIICIVTLAEKPLSVASQLAAACLQEAAAKRGYRLAVGWRSSAPAARESRS